jgi:hypothetical protein
MAEGWRGLERVGEGWRGWRVERAVCEHLPKNCVDECLCLRDHRGFAPMSRHRLVLLPHEVPTAHKRQQKKDIGSNTK